MRPAILGAIASGSQAIGGVQVGAAGTGIYSGYVLSGGDDFAALNLASSATPRGRYFTTRGYSSTGGMHAPATGPLAVMHDVEPTYTGWADSNRGIPIASLANSHTIVAGEGSALRLRTIRQSAEEQTLLATGVAGQIERGSMISGAGHLWWDSSAIIEWRARIPAGRYGHHPSLWCLSSTPPGGPSFTGNEYGWEGGRTEHEPYHNGWDAGSSVHNSGTKTNVYRDGNFHTFTVILSATDYKWYVDGSLYYTLAVDPDDEGNKPDYMMVTNHVYNATFESQTYDAADWALDVAPDGADVDIEWYRVWRPSAGTHYSPRTTISDVLVTAGGALSTVLPSQSTLWGATGLTEYVTAIANEREQPGHSSNTASFGQFPSGISYDSGTRTLSGTMPAQAGALYIAVGVTGDGNTCEVARFRICSAPVWSGSSSFSWTNGAPVSYDVYAGFDVGRLFQSGSNPKGLSVSGLPAGLSFSSSTGLITGTPTADSSGSLTISCTNSAGQTTSTSPTFIVATPSGVAAPVLTGSPALLASWDFGDDSTLTVTSGSIDSVAGADGTSFTLTQTGSARPTQVARDGKNTARFTSASSQFMSIASILGAASANGVTIVAIVEPATVAASQVILDIANSASTGGNNRLMLSGGASGWGARKASSTGFSDANLAASFTTAKRLLIAVNRIGAAASNLYVDGTATPVVSGTGQNWPTGMNITKMGARTNAGSTELYADGWIWRVLVYPELTATNYEEIATWAAANYGTTNGA